MEVNNKTIMRNETEFLHNSFFRFVIVGIHAANAANIGVKDISRLNLATFWHG
jgi:hypothetical protein